MKIKGKKLTVQQKKLLQAQSEVTDVKDWLYLKQEITSSTGNHHPAKNGEKIIQGLFQNVKTGEILRIRLN